MEKHLHTLERYLRNRAHRLPALWNEDIPILAVIEFLHIPPVDKGEEIYTETMAIYSRNGGGDWKEWIHLQRHDDPEAKDLEVEQEESSQTGDHDDSRMEDVEEEVEDGYQVKDVENEEGDQEGDQLGTSGEKAVSIESEEE